MVSGEREHVECRQLKIVTGDDTRVAELNLIRGDSFTLHFDFGDSYRFLFSVLEEIAGREENDVRLLSATGDPVLQYPGSSFDLLADD